MSKSKAKNYPIISRGDKVPPPMLPPAPAGAAVFHSGRFTVWRVGGAFTIYERRPFKVRRDEKSRPAIHHYDEVPIGPLADTNTDSGVDPAVLAAAKEAADFHIHGLT